jgi:tetratricopeptide (TPR) repeat protein
LKIQRSLLGGEHYSVANTLHNLAIVLWCEGKLAEAETTHRESLAMSRKVLGNDNSYVSGSLHDLGMLLRFEGKFAEAETMLREAVAAQRRVFGDLHPWVANSLFELASVLQQEGKLVESEALFREALAKRNSLFGKQQPITTATANSLFGVLSAAKKTPEALAVYAEWLEGHPQILNDRAWSLATSEISSERDGHSAIAFAEQAVAETHRTNAVFLETLAAACAETGQFTNAVSVQLEAIALTTNDNAKQDCSSRLRIYESNGVYRQINGGRLKAGSP